MDSWIDKISWFESDRAEEVFKYLEDDIEAGYEIFPGPDDIFNAYKYTPLDQVKVVILGQDPYPQPGNAHGLAFSVPPGTPLPRSLNNIYGELVDDVGVCPGNGCLTGWAEQGVFLLNTALTVRKEEIDSHKHIGWIDLINETIQTINKEVDHCVFVFWGAKAQAKSSYISRKKHKVITSSHPSPMAAHKGFFGSRPFSQTNEALIGWGLDPIDWGRTCQIDY